MAKKPEPFNNPFRAIKLAKPAPKPAPPRPRAPPQAPADDERLFQEAMADVAPIPDRGETPVPRVPLPHVVTEEAEALAQLAELVSGEGPFDIANTDEFLEGVAPDVDRRVMAALRRGDYAVQGHVDLHGMNRVEAHEAVDAFVARSRRDGKRCVLIVHGRGLNSKDQIPVLKEQLKVWLQRGRIARSVLAFCSARPHDGGAGALYVLLRAPGRAGG